MVDPPSSSGTASLDAVREPFGTTEDGRQVDRFTFGSDALRVSMLTLGAAIQRVVTPDRTGVPGDVALGVASVQEYQAQPVASSYFGVTVGRYANRIRGGRFRLDGVDYAVPVNDRGNALHGGTVGFDAAVWDAETVTEPGRVGVRFRHLSPDGNMGFPGALDTQVEYTVDSSGELRIRYQATTDAPTVVNLTNHVYLNLNGEGGEGVYDQQLTLAADAYLPTDSASIPVGPPAPVAGTPFDFRQPREIGPVVRTGEPQILDALGFDHTWVLNGRGDENGSPRFAAEVYAPRTGRVLECRTDQPGIQVYTGNQLTGAIRGLSGRTYRQGDAIALETQHFPDSPNQPSYPSTVLRPSEVFTSTTLYRFSTR